MNNPLLHTDSYNLTHWQMRKDVSKDIAYLYNREAPEIKQSIIDFKKELVKDNTL